MNKLVQYGLTERFRALAGMYPDFIPARVISQYNEDYRVVTQTGEFLAQVSGKFRYNAQKLSDFPAVGDFVMIDRLDDSGGNGIIHHVLPRKSLFERRAAGSGNDTQVVAANMDVVFICMSLNNDYNLRRLERYLSIAWDSGAIPVVVLTKSDLNDDIAGVLKEISGVAIGVDVVVTSALHACCADHLRPYIGGKTAVFIGSSGVGKSTLINALLGETLLPTSHIRQDDKGRHTTTRRDLIALPQGGAVIDTPGMREIGVETADLARSFADIDALVSQCRFRNCTHTKEQGCAVKAAIEDGRLDQARLNSYLKLKKEARYEGLNSRQIETEKLNEMFKDVGGIKGARRLIKDKRKY